MAKDSGSKTFGTLITVIVVIFVFGVLVLVFSPPTVGPHSGGPKVRTMSNTKQCTVVLVMYSVDYDDRLPPALTWMDASFPYCKNQELYSSAAVRDKDKRYFGLAFLSSLDRANLAKVLKPDTQPMIFDSVNIAWNATGGVDSMPVPGRYEAGEKRVNIVAFADGHAKAIPDSTYAKAGPFKETEGESN